MFSQNQRNSVARHSHLNGMTNIVFLAGTAHDLKERSGSILQSGNLNQAIRFEVEDGSVPSWVKPGDVIKVVGRIIPKLMPAVVLNEDDSAGSESADSERTKMVLNQTLKVLHFERPSIFDMNVDKAWKKSLRTGEKMRPGIPIYQEVEQKQQGETVVPPEQQAEENPDSGSSQVVTHRVYDNGNVVTVAGFVQSTMIESRPADEKTGQGSKCILILLRQTNADNAAILVRCYSSAVAAIKNRLKPGDPLLVQGKIQVHLKNTGRLNKDGVHIVNAVQYVHAVNNGLKVPSSKELMIEPDWRKDLIAAGKVSRKAAETSLEANQKSVSENNLVARNPPAAAVAGADDDFAV